MKDKNLGHKPTHRDSFSVKANTGKEPIFITPNYTREKKRINLQKEYPNKISLPGPSKSPKEK
ncbi:MAG: hypothetical protein AAB438_04160 [Patescibacteria group bacterium]